MSNGRYCDNCETRLNDEDYVSYGSWSYTCHDCGFSYRHGSAGVGEQVAKFNSRSTPRAVDKSGAGVVPAHLPSN
jgi:hypothetical protein